jgi:hypothetical protein
MPGKVLFHKQTLLGQVAPAERALAQLPGLEQVKCLLHPQTTAPDVRVFRANNVPQVAQYNFWSNSFSATLGL